MKFYTHNMKPGVLAEFEEIVSTPWGEHVIRGKILQSQRDGSTVVIWPTDGRRGRFVSTPPHSSIESANAYILDQYRAFNRRGMAA